MKYVPCVKYQCIGFYELFHLLNNNDTMKQNYYHNFEDGRIEFL